MGVPFGGLLVNRSLVGGAIPDPGGWVRALLSSAPGVPHLVAPLLGHGPVGAAELGRFLGEWRLVEHPEPGVNKEPDRHVADG
jgi:hypothetical protein